VGLIPTDEAAVKSGRQREIQIKLDVLGASAFACKLFGIPVLDPGVMDAVVALLSTLMAGGCETIQDTMHAQLISTTDDAFVNQVKCYIDKVVDILHASTVISLRNVAKAERAESQKSAETVAEGFHPHLRQMADNESVVTRFVQGGTFQSGKAIPDNEAEEEEEGGALPKELHLYPPVLLERMLRMLQMMCENHHTLNQTFMRTQLTGRATSAKNGVNLVSKIVDFFGTCTASILARHPPTGLDPLLVRLIEQSLLTLTEFVQGPCLENQVCIADSDFVGSARSILQAFLVNTGPFLPLLCYPLCSAD